MPAPGPGRTDDGPAAREVRAVMVMSAVDSPTAVIEVRRDEDDELLGFVAEAGSAWQATTVFGGLLGTHTDRDEAIDQVQQIGLSSLAERWWVRLPVDDGDEDDGDEDGGEPEWQRCHLIEAAPDRVVVVVATYAFQARPQVLPPGTPLQLHEPAER